MKSIIILSLLISIITNLAYAQTDSFRIHLKINDPQNQINDGQRIDITATAFANEGRTMLAEGHIYGDSVILTGHVSHPTVTMIAIETESPRSFRSYKILLENTDYHVTMSWVPGSGFEVITDSRFHNLWSSVISSNREFEDEKRFGLVNMPALYNRDASRKQIVSSI